MTAEILEVRILIEYRGTAFPQLSVAFEPMQAVEDVDISGRPGPAGTADRIVASEQS